MRKYYKTIQHYKTASIFTKKNEWNVRMRKLCARMRLAYLKDRRNFWLFGITEKILKKSVDEITSIFINIEIRRYRIWNIKNENWIHQTTGRVYSMQCDFVMTVSCLKTSRRAFHVGKWLIVQDSGECQVSTRWEKISYTQVIIYIYLSTFFELSFIFFFLNIVFFPVLSNIHLCEWIVHFR